MFSWLCSAYWSRKVSVWLSLCFLKSPIISFMFPWEENMWSACACTGSFLLIFAFSNHSLGGNKLESPKSVELEAMQVRIVTLSNRDKDRADQIIMQGGQLEPGPVCMPRSYHCNLQHFCQQLQTQIQIQNSKSTKYK